MTTSSPAQAMIMHYKAVRPHLPHDDVAKAFIAAIIRIAANQVILPINPSLDSLDDCGQGFKAARAKYHFEFLAIANELQRSIG